MLPISLFNIGVPVSFVSLVKF